MTKTLTLNTIFSFKNKENVGGNGLGLQRRGKQFMGSWKKKCLIYKCLLDHIWASLVAQLVKNPPAMWETWVQSLGWEDPLEKGKATPVFWPGAFHRLYSPCGEGNGNPFQYSCLETPMDGGAW